MELLVELRRFIFRYNNEEVESVIVEGDMLKIALKNGVQQLSKKEAGESLSQLLKNFNISADKIDKFNIEVKEESGWEFWLSTLLPFLFPLLLIGLFIYFMFR